MPTEVIETNAVTENNQAAREEEFSQPRFTSARNQDDVELRVWMPGVSRDGVDVSLDDDQLTIIGRRRDRVPDAWRPLFVELGNYDYRLRVRLNLRVDTDGIKARVEDGVLTLTLPIHGEAKPRRIEVR